MDRRIYLALAAVVALLGLANSSTGQEEKLEKVRVGLASNSATESANWFGKEARMFEKYSLFVELIRLQGSSLVVSTMLAGEIPISQIGAAAVVDSDLGGADSANTSVPDDMLRRGPQGVSRALAGLRDNWFIQE